MHGLTVRGLRGVAGVPSRESQPPALAIDILRCYMAHPAMADSLEGIAEWRLLDEIVHRRMRETGVALRWLVDQGFLDCSAETPVVPAIYRLNVGRRLAAEDLIARDARRQRRRRSKALEHGRDD